MDVRIIAATNKNVEKAVREGTFREDLYYRLNVVPVVISPLRERRDDIPVLIDHFLKYFSLDVGKPMLTMETKLVERLTDYEWPGNVRELKNVIQRLIFDADNQITLEDYETTHNPINTIRQQNKLFNFRVMDEIRVLKELESEFKFEYVKYVRDHSSSDADAASKLGLAPSNFHRLCKDLGLK